MPLQWTDQGPFVCYLFWALSPSTQGPWDQRVALQTERVRVISCSPLPLDNMTGSVSVALTEGPPRKRHHLSCFHGSNKIAEGVGGGRETERGSGRETFKDKPLANEKGAR